MSDNCVPYIVEAKLVGGTMPFNDDKCEAETRLLLGSPTSNTVMELKEKAIGYYIPNLIFLLWFAS